MYVPVLSLDSSGDSEDGQFWMKLIEISGQSKVAIRQGPYIY